LLISPAIIVNFNCHYALFKGNYDSQFFKGRFLLGGWEIPVVKVNSLVT